MFKPLEIKNVIPVEYQEEIYRYVTDVNFPWYFLEDTTYEGPPSGTGSTPAFVNLIYHTNKEEHPHLDFFRPLVDSIVEKASMELISVFRIRIGFLLNTKYVYMGSPYQYNTPHVDGDMEHYTACYYVNTCDGPTVLFHEKEKSEKYRPMHKSDPEQGKVLIFDGQHYHASTCPKVFNKRIVLTVNFSAKLKK
jgi:hypothetical protein